MPRTLTKTVRLEGGILLSPTNKRWEKQFKALPKEVQKSIIARGAIVEDADDETEEEEDEQVPVSALADRLADFADAAEVRRLQKADKRVTAQAVYEARLKELEASE